MVIKQTVYRGMKLQKGVAADSKQAVEWYRKSAEQGNVSVICNLGYCYETGIGVKKT